MFKIIFIFFIFLTALLILYKPAQKGIYSFFNQPYRKILSTVKGPLMGNHSSVQVFKLETEKGLLLEFYDVKNKGSHRKISSILLAHPHDSYFHFRGRPTNLFILDIDKDGTLEVIAPSYDKNLVSHFHIFHYDRSSGSFIRSDLDFL